MTSSSTNKGLYTNKKLIKDDRIKFDDYDAMALNSKYRKFVSSLSKAETVVLSSMDLGRMFGELALIELIENNDFRNTFERHELEILQMYYIRGATKQKIKEEFAERFDPIDTKFYTYCFNLHRPGSRSNINKVKLFIRKKWIKVKNHIVTMEIYTEKHWVSILRRLKGLGYSEQKPYHY